MSTMASTDQQSQSHLTAEVVNILLGTYSVSTTLVIIGLIFYMLSLRRKYYSVRDLSSLSKDDLANLNGSNNNMCHDIDEIPPQRSTLQRTRSAPIHQRELSVYDPITSTSMVRSNPFPKADLNQSPENHYEEMLPTGSDTEPHHYETILEDVCNTLTSIHKNGAQDKEGDVYQKFFNELMKKIKSKDSHFYESLRNNYKNHNYPSRGVSKSDYDSDESYAKFIPPVKNDKCYGSDDHVKYLTESKIDLQRQENETRYLEAKRFNPTPDCPENIRLMCENQDSDTGSNSTGLTEARSIEQGEQNRYVVGHSEQNRYTVIQDEQTRKVMEHREQNRYVVGRVEQNRDLMEQERQKRYVVGETELNRVMEHRKQNRYVVGRGEQNRDLMGQERQNRYVVGQTEQIRDVRGHSLSTPSSPALLPRPNAFNSNSLRRQRGNEVLTAPNPQKTTKKQGPPVPPRQRRNLSSCEDDDDSIF